MNNNETILAIVSVVSITIIGLTIFLANFSKNMKDKDIELGSELEIKLLEGTAKSTFRFGCKNILNDLTPKLKIKQYKRKKRMIRKCPPSYHSTNFPK